MPNIGGIGCVMIRLVVLLGVGVFLTMLIGGRDGGPQRLGLTGAYPPLVPVSARVAPPAADSAAVIEVAPPAPIAVTRASFSPAQDAPLPDGLTLALPLMEEPATGGVQTGDGLFSDTTAPADPTRTASLPVHYIIGSQVNVRESPSAKAPVLEKLLRGEAVTVLASDTPGWSLIRIEGDGLEGYVASRYLSDAGAD